MEWLHHLHANPAALASFMAWLKERERECAEYALDVDEKLLGDLRGKRTAFRDIQAYVNNNAALMQRSNTSGKG